MVLLNRLMLALVAGSAAAQSLNVKTPAAMSSGSNKGTIDSFGGDQFWFFMVQPGSFKVTFRAANGVLVLELRHQ